MRSVLDPPGLREWERQRDEPPAAWFAFKRWRDTNATFTAVADELDVEPNTVSRWAKDWGWKARKLAYDRYVSAGDADIAKVNSENLAATHLTAAALARQVALQSLRRLLDELQADPRAVSASAAARLLAEATKLERLTLGLATERTENAPDYSRLTDEEFEAVRRGQAKACGDPPES